VRLERGALEVEFSELFLRCHDASVFQEKNNHVVLSRVFYDDNNASRALEQDQYFIIGEKGTGKTIIAQYLSNIRTEKNCSVLDFSSIDFETFRKLSNEGHFKFIQADQIWQVLLMVIAAEIVVKNEADILSFIKFKEFHDAIREFYNDRFSPEFPVAVQLVENAEFVGKLSQKYVGEAVSSVGLERTINSQKGESPLNNVRSHFADAFKKARIRQDHVIFIDRIDVKPDDVDFEKFIHSLRSFVRAALYLNEQVFPKMKGQKRIKFVLLLRPDIFDKLNLQNQSARVSDNSLVLNWDTTYDSFRNSSIFALADRFLGRQTNINFEGGEAWDYFVEPSVLHSYEREHADGINKSFREFLRLSWFRPRDIIRGLHICQEQPECRSKVTRDGFEKSIRRFSDYMYGEVKDFSRFYFSDDTFDLIERFFSEVQRLDVMNYDSFRRAHEEFVRKLKASPINYDLDPRVADPDSFLQILYSSNIICWRTRDEYGGVEDYWAFRERTAAQLEPKVGHYCDYAVHYGLRRALRVNRKLVTAVRD
jgi:hypothetical protein